MMFLPHYLFGWSWTETLYRAMILLVVASPCALVASVMPATLSAISNGARHGILFKGGAHLESLSHLKMIAFDKTGTLTKGKPEVTNFIARDNDRTHLILQNIASVENESTHPLAQAIVRYAQSLQIDLISPHSEVEDIVGRGVKATVNGVDWAIGKPEFVGKEEAERFADGIFTTWAHEGKTVIFARDDNGIAAVIGLKDIIRPDAKETILSLKKMKIQSIMLTGDAENTAKAIAKESKLDHYVAECLPEMKVEHIKELKKQYGAVAMVGDGINDAPALATADIGIAMGGGTDIALETSDVVLMKDELTRIADSIKLSKRMNRIIKQNIFISISVILVLIASNFLAMIDLPLGVIGHEGSTILVILNGLRLLR